MYYIYTLVCPLENRVRYIGQTKSSLQKRLSQHIWESKKDKKRYSHKDNWILKLSRLNLKPIISHIEIIPIEKPN